MFGVVGRLGRPVASLPCVCAGTSSPFLSLQDSAKERNIKILGVFGVAGKTKFSKKHNKKMASKNAFFFVCFFFNKNNKNNKGSGGVDNQ